MAVCRTRNDTSVGVDGRGRVSMYMTSSQCNAGMSAQELTGAGHRLLACSLPGLRCMQAGQRNSPLPGMRAREQQGVLRVCPSPGPWCAE
eukprot:1158310-Pelagomonas_calceolata.AAC.2